MNAIPILPIVLFLVFLNLYTGFHGYIFFQSIKWKIGPRFPVLAQKLTGRLYWLAFIFLAGLYAGIRFERGLRSIFSLANAYWGIILFLPLLAALDAVYFVRFVMRVVRRFRRTPERPAARFLGPLFTFVSHLVIIAIVVSITVYGSWRARSPVVTEYKIKTEKPLPGGKLEAILVSDIHIGALVSKERLGRMVNEIAALKGDIIFIAGDILDRGMEMWEQENIGAEFSRLKANLGVWAVPGNHEYYGGHINELRENLAACRIIMLEDEVVETGGLYVIGRKDLMSGRWGQQRKSLVDLARSLDKSRFIIVMDHQPVNLEKGEEAGIDLQVSGHTHHGQIWPGSIMTGRIFEKDYGLLYKGKSAFVVSSGYGTWGPSLRIGTHSEIVRIVLTN
ncbi:MAG: metallophosphoesterase [Treponema sp.]|jgi:predicted MPP superfamily phosphohydrolase|nr:metallophosphoesterase [Treponema sp.]